MDERRTDRRDFLRIATQAGAAAGLGACLNGSAGSPWATVARANDAEVFRPAKTADNCIFLWLGGGACHVDTFDPKRKGDAAAKKAGSYYDAIDTAVPDVQVCEHLPRLAKQMDRCVLMRSVHHDVIDEHAAAVNRVHVGRPPTGTTLYPSIGSVMSHELGADGEGVPAYVVMGYPSASRGPGFLGARHSYVYLTDTDAGPAGLQRPDGLGPARIERREALLAELRERYRKSNSGDRAIEAYIDTSVEAMKLAGPKFMSVFDLKNEADSLREAYGGEFGQRCLLARRLVESGVRFVEVSFNLNFINGTGWDTHNDGQRNQHILIEQLDQAMSTMIADLEQRGRLDRTLIVVATEFGRPPEFDGGGGRGHYSKAFSMVLAGGGLRTGHAIGTTDELGKTILDSPVSIPDFHATIYAAMGIDPSKELYDGDRPVPITDRGTPVRQAFA
ncbi:MAG: DUF1501 domain-containing protein [Planctomycetales bacterium]|nr:DUF1501 domain-containing protein [Planctomycetales bacterium]